MGKIQYFVVLGLQGMAHGYQGNFRLDFPSAPSGTIEYSLCHAISVANDSGTAKLSFEDAASSELHT